MIWQRVYVALRTFDAYSTCLLGLPRKLHVIEPATDPMDASSIDSPEMTLAADANMELLDILGTAVERRYFRGADTNSAGPVSVQYNQLSEVGSKLERWTRKYAAVDQVTESSLGRCTR